MLIMICFSLPGLGKLMQTVTPRNIGLAFDRLPLFFIISPQKISDPRGNATEPRGIGYLRLLPAL